MMTDKSANILYICPDHPAAGVIHTYDSDLYEAGRRLRTPKKHNHRYECAVCNRPLAAEKPTKGTT